MYRSFKRLNLFYDSFLINNLSRLVRAINQLNNDKRYIRISRQHLIVYICTNIHVLFMRFVINVTFFFYHHESISIRSSISIRVIFE